MPDETPLDNANWQAEMREDSRSNRLDSEEWHAYVREGLAKHEQRLTKMEAKLDANSAATERVELSTRGIVETMSSWNGAMKTIESIGKALRPLTWIVTFIAAIVGLYATIRHGGDAP